MKYRIVKKYYTDNTPYYIVQQKKIFRWWGIPDHTSLSKVIFSASGYIIYIEFKSVADAENAVKIAKISYELKDEVIKEF